MELVIFLTMFIERSYNLADILQSGKVLVLYGPRRVGKTTLLNSFLSGTTLKYKLDSGDNIKIQQLFQSQDFTDILDYAEGYELVAIDEAQEIANIGKGLKILVDQRPDLRIIATGSSSFELSKKIGEPLTGRKITRILFPISQLELNTIYNKHELKEQLENMLIYGSYPEVITTKDKAGKRELLEELVQSYLLKDILAHGNIRGSNVIYNLLKLLAFQTGSEVSFNELSNTLGIDTKTVQHYIDLLEKTFVILSVKGFSRNLRKEINKKNKYYFWDTGIRNAVISQFNSMDLRNDIGQLWENFIVIERLKKNTYHRNFTNSWFWRTYNKQEIDLVEEKNGQLSGYEIKWSPDKKTKVPTDWKKTYPDARFEIINNKNYLDFILNGVSGAGKRGGPVPKQVQRTKG